MIQLTGEANKITPRVLLDGGGKKALGSLDIDPTKQGLTNKAFVDLLFSNAFQTLRLISVRKL